MVPQNFPSVRISKLSDVDVIVEYFQSHPNEYDSIAESWIEDILHLTGYTGYYQQKMKTSVKAFTPITNHCYRLGKEKKVYAKIEKLERLKKRLDREINRQIGGKSVFQKHQVLKLHQPVASLVVYGLIKTIKTDSLPYLHKDDSVFIYAEAATKKSMRGFCSNDSLYGTYHNALAMGIVEQCENMPKDCYVGFVKVEQQRTQDGFYVVKGAYAFREQVQDLSDCMIATNYTKPDIPKIRFENGILRIPLNDELWGQMERLEGHFFLYWKTEFNNFYSSEDGLGYDGRLYDIIFEHRANEKRFIQNDVTAVTKQEFVCGSNDRVFWGLVVNFEKLSLKKKYEESSFYVLQKREWILDWKCVKFKNGYFVVVPPVDESVKFRPQAFSKPGVIESYNYLKEYLKDRLAPVRCSVEEMKLTICDTIRLDDAITKFATASKQRAIKTATTKGNVRIAPQQISFKQALSKALKMTEAEFEKYKSEYINYLVKLQSKKYKVIPCVERLSHANNDMNEYAFMFSIECQSGNVLIVHENVNPDRSTLLFWVKETTYNKAIREIYDFLQSAEINKRSNLRGGNIDISNAGILKYKSINHDDIWTWKRMISIYVSR
ncbi:MAG: hypothetical protein IJ615_00195 [Bacteroidaceae bacterium]|nr:hypothetical protein [Bacteroidaceae bacterium]